jgi:hypothetical protein
VALDLAARVDQRVALIGLGSRRLDAVGIALGVAELERILAHFGTGQQIILRAVEQCVEARFGADAVVMVAARADEAIVFPFLGEDHGAALGALVPQIVGVLALAQPLDAIANAAQPAHRNPSCSLKLRPYAARGLK